MADKPVSLGNTVDLVFPDGLKAIGRVGALTKERTDVHIETANGRLMIGVPASWLVYVRPNRWTIDIPGLPTTL